MLKSRILKKVFIILLLTCLWAYRYYTFNAEIAEIYTPHRTYYTVNDAVEYTNNIINLHTYKGCSIILKRAKLVDKECFLRQFNIAQIYERDDYANSSKICLLELEFINNSTQNVSFDIGDLVLCGNDKILNLSEFTADINPQLDLENSSRITVLKSGAMSFLMPFVLTNDGFSPKEWNRAEEYQLFLYITQFPEERIICINYE